MNGRNLSIGTDVNDVFEVFHIIYLIAMAFRLKEKCSETKYESLQKLNEKVVMHASFYKNQKTGVYYLNTYYKDKRYGIQKTL